MPAKYRKNRSLLILISILLITSNQSIAEKRKKGKIPKNDIQNKEDIFYQNQVNITKIEKNLTDTEKEVKLMKISQIDFNEVSLKDVCRYFSFMSKRFSSNKKSINIILNVREERKETPVTLMLRNESLEECIKTVCQVTNLDYEIKDGAVVIKEKDKSKKNKEQENLDNKPLEKLLKSTKVSHVNLVDAPLTLICRYLSKINSRIRMNQKSINFLLNVSEEKKESLLSFKLKNVSMEECIKTMCKLGNLNYELQGYIIILTSKEEEIIKE